jgi:hypothetical protein
VSGCVVFEVDGTHRVDPSPRLAIAPSEERASAALSTTVNENRTFGSQEQSGRDYRRAASRRADGAYARHHERAGCIERS